MQRLLQPSRRAVVIGLPVLAIVILGLIFGLRAALGGGGDDKGSNASPTATGKSAGLLQETITGLQGIESRDLAGRDTAGGISGTNPDAPVPGGEGDRLIIPSINVDAPLTMKVVGPDGQMPNPDGPQDVVWYDFSGFSGLGGRPGVGGNTVLSGHVDYHNYGPAVFWDLNKLEEGTEIDVHLRDGSTYKYSVSWNRVVDPGASDWADIVKATPQESLTMVTCAGTFDSTTRSYDHRRVVWAVRVS